MSLDKRHLWSSEEIEAFERWEMPDLTGISLRNLGREKISDEIIEPVAEEGEPTEEEVVQLPTPEEVQAVRAEAYELAYAEGLEQGRHDGFEQGREDGFLKGKAEGYDDGAEKGYAEGLQRGEREVNDSLTRLNSILALLHEPIATQHEELEGVLYELVQYLVTLMLHRELKLDSSVVLQIVRDSLDALPRNSERIRVFVHPDDYELCRKQAEGQIDPWQVFADENVSRGGCRVETLASLIDATIESRLEDLLSQVVSERYAAASREVDQLAPKEQSEEGKTFSDSE